MLVTRTAVTRSAVTRSAMAALCATFVVCLPNTSPGQQSTEEARAAAAIKTCVAADKWQGAHEAARAFLGKKQRRTLAIWYQLAQKVLEQNRNIGPAIRCW